MCQKEVWRCLWFLQCWSRPLSWQSMQNQTANVSCVYSQMQCNHHSQVQCVQNVKLRTKVTMSTNERGASLSYTFVNDLYCFPFSPTFTVLPAKAGGHLPHPQVGLCCHHWQSVTGRTYLCLCEEILPWQHRLQMLLDGFHILACFLPWRRIHVRHLIYSDPHNPLNSFLV